MAFWCQKKCPYFYNAVGWAACIGESGPNSYSPVGWWAGHTLTNSGGCLTLWDPHHHHHHTQYTEVLGLAPLLCGQGLDAFCRLSTSKHICTIVLLYTYVLLWWWTVVWWREPSARSLQSEMIHLSVIIITPSWWASIHCTGIPTLLQRLTSTLFSFDLTQY